jgi:hypothetical protein
MATALDLMSDVYANFLNAYGGQTGSVTLAFEPLGLMPGIDPASPGAADAALELVSTNADALPDLSGGAYVATGRTLSGTYAIILNGAQAAPGVDTDGFNRLKAQALEALNNGQLGSLQGPFRYYPSYASPANWYDPAATANWSSYSYSTPPSATSSSTSPPPPVFHPAVFRMQPWQLRAVTIQSPAVAPVAQTAAPAVHAVPSAVQPHPIGSMFATHLQTAQFAPVAAPPTPVPAAPPPADPQLSISFDYCVIRLNRPWFNGDFLASGGWFLAGAHAGDYAPGAVAPAASSATASSSETPPIQPPMAWVPVAAIAVKNVAIRSNAVAGQTGVSTFGPFSLHAASPGGDSLANPGIQIIAWICAAQPRLPPIGDPALTPPTEAQTVAGIAGVAVDLLGGLLGQGGGPAASSGTSGGGGAASNGAGASAADQNADPSQPASVKS